MSEEIIIRNISELIHQQEHYKFIEKYGKVFAQELGNPQITDVNDMAVADGDKCYSYKNQWWEAGIPFALGVMIYLISKYKPYSEQVRNTDHGWVAPVDWVVSTWNTAMMTRMSHPIYKAVVGVYVSYRQELNKQ